MAVLSGFFSSAQGVPPASKSVIRLARSADGLSFVDSGELLLPHAAAPGLVVGRHGELLAIFDAAAAGADNRPTVLSVTRSRNSGRTWSAVRSVRLDGIDAKRWQARLGSFVPQSGGLRLYFTATTPAGVRRSTDDPDAPLILSALTRDGHNYRLDPSLIVDPGDWMRVRPLAAMLHGRVHLFLVHRGPGGGSTFDAANSLQHFVSRDGRRFARLRAPQLYGLSPEKERRAQPAPETGAAGDKATYAPKGFLPGSIVLLGDRLRMYGTGPDGIRSLVSRDGHHWAAEPGVRFSGGWDPAVARLRDGSFVMLYCAPPQPDAAPDTALVDLDWTDDFDDSMHDELTAEDDLPADGEAEAAEGTERIGEAAAREVEGAEGDPEAESVTLVAPENNEGDTEEERRRAEAFERGDWLALWNPIATGGFAPTPDFKTKVDYLEWYRDFAREIPADNAWYAYAAFIPTRDETDAEKPEWPEKIVGMFSGSKYKGPPGPWDPAEHPEWEASYQQMQDLIQRYTDAARHEGYVAPARFATDEDESRPDDTTLLVEFLLPTLSHHRALARAMLEGAWRKQDGKVSPERMLEAWQTVLRNAGHLEQGATLIESLVGLAQRSMVRTNARWALRHGVLSGAELQSALQTLRKHDRGAVDYSPWVRGEHGMVMDLTQYLFSPPGPDGEPRLNLRHVRRVAPWEWNVERTEEEVLSRLEKMGPDDAYAAIEAVDLHYRELARQMNIGYPNVRVADIAALEELTVHTSPITEMVLPAMSRYYILQTRGEAARRATQLAYALHIFKEQNGHFPQTLADVPAELGLELRIDPFTGGYFGYRLTEEGPIIYSLSENAVDDGGVHAPRWDDRPDPETGSDDHVFWPPQHRR